MTEQMIIRIDPELKNRFSTLAKAEGKNASEVVRELIEEYVADRDIGAYIDDLWSRIGSRLKARKVGARKIREAVKKARTKK